MSERYAGAAGETQLRQDEERWGGAERAERQAARRDLEGRVPYGRVLDLDDLLTLCDEATQTSRAIILRKRLLAEIRKSLPLGILIDRTELELLRADSIEHPTRPGPCPKIAEWPASR